jgi:hypothetical protein
MKLTLFLIFTWISLGSLLSQSAIFGINSRGGNGSGHIFKYSTTENSFDIVYNFQTFLGDPGFKDEFLVHPNGKLYSFVVLPCSIGICSYSPSTNEYKILAQTEKYASEVFGKPAIGSNGLLYGIGGLTSEPPVIFSYNIQTNQLDTAALFKEEQGRAISSLTNAPNGKFYFNTNAGICCFDPAKPALDAISVVKEYEGLSGELIAFENGTLWGGTTSGIFSFNYAQNTFEIKAQLSSIFPNGLIKSTYDSMLYGLCGGNGSTPGQLFRLNIQTNQLTTIHTFDGIFSDPKGKLTQSGNKLFGTTLDGPQGIGSIFSYDMSTSSFQDQYPFANPSSDQYPIGTLALHGNGLLYALTGGGNYSGSVIQLNPVTGDLRNVISLFPTPFNPVNYPSENPMVLGSDGLLYGIFLNYPNYLFSFDPVSYAYQKRSNLPVEKDFYNLTDAGNGMLYISALDKNSTVFNDGSILRYNTQMDSITAVYQATGFPKMTYMIAGNDSELYGYCQATNYDDLGLCKFSPATQTLTLIKQFYGTSLRPGLLQKSASGKIIGIPKNKYGSGGTILFSYDPATLNYENLYSFPNNETTNYPTDFCIGNDQKVYGIRMDAQLNWFLFSYDLIENTYRSNTEIELGYYGSFQGKLIAGIDNLIYGITDHYQSPKIRGGFFSIDPSSEQFEESYHTGASCGTSGSGLVEVRNPDAYKNCEGDHCWYLFPNPSSGTFTLNLLQGEVPQSLQIYNVMGQLVMELNELKAYQKVSVEQLRSGVYTVKMNFSDTSITTSLMKY